MSRLVDAEKLFKEIVEVYNYEYPTASGDFDEFVTKVLPNVFADAPSAEERKHGYWQNRGRVDQCCSVCGETPDCEQGETPREYDFCPYCGAIMDD